MAIIFFTYLQTYFFTLQTKNVIGQHNNNDIKYKWSQMHNYATIIKTVEQKQQP